MNSEELTLLKEAFPCIDFTEKFEQEFATLWEEKHFSKGDFITEAGRKERYFYFVLEGVQMIYLIDNKGDHRVFGFTYRGDFSGVYSSFIRNRPSDYFLECLSESRVWAMNLENYLNLFEAYPEFNRWGRLFYQQILLGRHQREVELLMLSSEERYTKFMRRCPEPLKNIPQKYLASYLNMKPETFSRLRRKIRY
ncbi:MAG: Crp/Fnr family transcriptional regulator [Bacteroidota bacterium]